MTAIQLSHSPKIVNTEFDQKLKKTGFSFNSDSWAGINARNVCKVNGKKGNQNNQFGGKFFVGKFGCQFNP